MQSYYFLAKDEIRASKKKVKPKSLIRLLCANDRFELIFKILKLSIIRYLALSLTTCHIAPIHTERVDFRLKVSLTFYGKGWTRGRCFSKYICIFEFNSKILSLVGKNIQASLILFHSFIRIFVRASVNGSN